MIRLAVRGRGRREQVVEAVIDTGFTGFAALPPSVLAALRLPLIGRSPAVLANGSEVLIDIYEIEILWDGRWRTVEAGSIDAGALVGMALLGGHSLYLEATAGGRVTIEALP